METQSEPQSDRPNAAKTAIDESTLKINALGIDSNGSSSGLEAGDDPRTQAHTENEAGEDEDEEDEETTCPFCLFQRRGPCGRQFRAWEK